MPNTQEITLSIPEISCEHCVKTIHHALSVLPGVEAVLTDVLTKTVHLKYDPNQLSPETIEAQLGNAGYTIAR